MSDDREDDGLGSFDLNQIGMSGGAFGSAQILKFDTDRYLTRAGQVIGPEQEPIALGLVKIVQKWVDGKLAEPPLVVPSGEQAPDVKAMNEAAPREEWGVDPYSGNPCGPYVLVLVLKLLNERTLDRYAFLSRSKGGAVGIGDFTDKCKFMRRLKGPDVVPVVSLRHVPWPIKRLKVVKQRPHFEVLRWIKLSDSGGDQLPAPEAPPSPKWVGPPMPPPAPATPAAPPPAAAPAASPTPPAAAKTPVVEAPATAIGTPIKLGETVSEPTLKEEMKDEVLF
jgi:hypothetical protein